MSGRSWLSAGYQGGGGFCLGPFLAARLPERRPGGMAADLHTTHWLFPGRQPDRPAHPTTLMHRLNALGIHARDNRNTAMRQLAAELPAVVIADLLGGAHRHRNQMGPRIERQLDRLHGGTQPVNFPITAFEYVKRPTKATVRMH